MLRLNADIHNVESRLINHQIPCPTCNQPLHPWGHDRPRRIRAGITNRHIVRIIRRRRARCPNCVTTHIIQNPRLTDHRRDTTRVIQHALKLKHQQHGYRYAANQTDRPDSTVRNWYRHHQTHPEWPNPTTKSGSLFNR